MGLDPGYVLTSGSIRRRLDFYRHRPIPSDDTNIPEALNPSPSILEQFFSLPSTRFARKNLCGAHKSKQYRIQPVRQYDSTTIYRMNTVSFKFFRCFDLCSHKIASRFDLSGENAPLEFIFPLHRCPFAV